MPNQPRPENTQIGLRVPRELFAKLQKAAASRRMALSEFLRWALFEITKNTHLDEHDHQRIADEIKAARKKR